MFIAALLIIAKKKNTKIQKSLTVGWINELQYCCTIKYYRVVELWLFDPIWVNTKPDMEQKRQITEYEVQKQTNQMMHCLRIHMRMVKSIQKTQA